MITRNDVISRASMDCLKELYSKVQPFVDWDDFMQQNKDYSEKYKEWEEKRRNGELITLEEFCGPRPFEFYYLPADTMKEISDSYVRAYELDAHTNLLDIIEILKGYCNKPIEEAYVEESDGEKRRGYIYPSPIQEWIAGILRGYYDDSECNDHTTIARELCEEFFHYLDKAGKFFSWNMDINSFNTTVYLGPSPCSNKQRVIDNWKLYRGIDIKIDDSVYIEEDEWK